MHVAVLLRHLGPGTTRWRSSRAPPRRARADEPHGALARSSRACAPRNRRRRDEHGLGHGAALAFRSGRAPGFAGPPPSPPPTPHSSYVYVNVNPPGADAAARRPRPVWRAPAACSFQPPRQSRSTPSISASTASMSSFCCRSRGRSSPASRRTSRAAPLVARHLVEVEQLADLGQGEPEALAAQDELQPHPLALAVDRAPARAARVRASPGPRRSGSRAWSARTRGEVGDGVRGLARRRGGLGAACMRDRGIATAGGGEAGPRYHIGRPHRPPRRHVRPRSCRPRLSPLRAARRRGAAPSRRASCGCGCRCRSRSTTSTCGCSAAATAGRWSTPARQRGHARALGRPLRAHRSGRPIARASSPPLPPGPPRQRRVAPSFFGCPVTMTHGEFHRARDHRRARRARAWPTRALSEPRHGRADVARWPRAATGTGRACPWPVRVDAPHPGRRQDRASVATAWPCSSGYGHSPSTRRCSAPRARRADLGRHAAAEDQHQRQRVAVEPDGDPLGRFLDSLARSRTCRRRRWCCRRIGLPFRGIPLRVAQLRGAPRPRDAWSRTAAGVAAASAAEMVPVLFRARARPAAALLRDGRDDRPPQPPVAAGRIARTVATTAGHRASPTPITRPPPRGRWRCPRPPPMPTPQIDPVALAESLAAAAEKSAR